MIHLPSADYHFLCSQFLLKGCEIIIQLVMINFLVCPCQVPESSEISIGLYTGDVKEGKEKPLSEAFIIPWTDDGYSGHPDLLLKLKCLFTVSTGGLLLAQSCVKLFSDLQTSQMENLMENVRDV